MKNKISPELYSAMNKPEVRGMEQQVAACYGVDTRIFQGRLNSSANVRSAIEANSSTPDALSPANQRKERASE